MNDLMRYDSECFRASATGKFHRHHNSVTIHRFGAAAPMQRNNWQSLHKLHPEADPASDRRMKKMEA